MRVLLISLFALLLSVPVMAEPVPERRLILERNIDLPGGDFQSLFDTTLTACQAACLTSPQCTAMTFNARSNSCFLKEATGDRADYEGAFSGHVAVTNPDVIAVSPQRAQALSFLPEADLKQALTQANSLAALHPAGGWSAQALRDAARDRENSGDAISAMRFTGSAISVSDAPEHWVEYARLAVRSAQQDSSKARAYLNRAVPAAVNAYLRSLTDSQQATALYQLALALDANRRGRDMIPSLRLAQSIAPREDAAQLLESAIGKFGFRITETRVESDLAAPRICSVFSEPLAKGVDYAPFVVLPQNDLSLSVDERQLCIGGLSHGDRYRLSFRQGLPAQSGETLYKSVDITQYVRDRSPAVSFPGRAYILPAKGPARLPISTVNMSEVNLTLFRMSDRNLLRADQQGFLDQPIPPYQSNEFSAELAEEIWQGVGEVRSPLNEEVTTNLPIGEMIGQHPPGIYALQASIEGKDPYEFNPAMQWFIISDLGLSTISGTDGLHVFVRGLQSAETKSGVSVSLLAENNTVIATLKTDTAGTVRFDAGLTRGAQGSAPAMVLATDETGDLSYLSLTDAEFDLSDRGVTGRAPAGPIDVFLSTDRGAYRAGDTLHATALARTAVSEAIEGVPITAILYRPDGVEYQRQVSDLGIMGGHVFALPLTQTAPRGTWKLSIYADTKADPLANARVLVEDFLPERIAVNIALPDTPLRLGRVTPITVDAQYLFGSPAADLPIEGDVALTPKRHQPDYPGYVFGPADDMPDTARRYLTQTLKTDDLGKARILAEFPETETDFPLYEASFTIRVNEGAGRPVERVAQRMIAPAQPVIGIKPQFDDVVSENSAADFSLIALPADGAATEVPVSWHLNRLETRYQWYQLYGNWQWEPTTLRNRVKAGTATLGARPVAISAPVEWGEYELVVESTEGPYTVTTHRFFAGWYAPADTTVSPDVLTLSLDQPSYAVGDTAQLRILSQSAGQAVVTVLSNRLIDRQIVSVPAGDSVIAVPVTEDWGAGAYVTASVISPLQSLAAQTPPRRLGLAYATVSPAEKQLQARLEIAKETQPRQPLEVSLEVAGAVAGETVYATLAAVDLGILNLTGYQTPDPSEYYFGQRKLGVGLRDVYGRLIDARSGLDGRVRSGGDASAHMRLQSPPPTEDLVTFFKGPMTVGADGKLQTTLDLPAFNGTLRVMAIVWSKTGVGQASADVLVRDPVVLQANLPRFLAPGDTTDIGLSFTHTSGPTGNFDVAVHLDADPDVLFQQEITLSEGAKQALTLPITAGDSGTLNIRVALTAADGTRQDRDFDIAIVDNDPKISRRSRFTLAAQESFVFDDNVFAGFRPHTGQATIGLGPLAQLDAAGLITQLSQYPYGCTEQITSKALPYLYLSDVAQAAGLSTAITNARYITQSISQILTRQGADGGFGLWRSGGGDLWLDAYVTDFLARAHQQGHLVPNRALTTALDNLRNQIAYAPDFDIGGEAIAYGLLVLARQGAAAMGDLRYFADEKAENFATPLALAQLATALAQYGDQARADRLFLRAQNQVAATPVAFDEDVFRTDFGTDLRDAAGLLALAVESDTAVVDQAALLRRITPPDGVRSQSTQEMSWTLLAAHALMSGGGATDILMDGVTPEGPLISMREDAMGQEPVVFQNRGTTPVEITVTQIGVPEVAAQAGGEGYRIARRYYTLDGTPVEVSQIKSGTRLVAVLSVDPLEDRFARLMINDPLPAGFEIDNPSLISSADTGQFDWLSPSIETEMTEFRSDRFRAAVDWSGRDGFELSYILRAVQPGHYHHPAAQVEDMYRPHLRAQTNAGAVRVTR